MKPDLLLHKPKILVVPLDWGLGHATRCIPIIRQLLYKDCEVLLAGEGKTANLLRTEFPQLPLLPLKGYNVSYGKTAWESMGKILLQVPRIMSAIEEEREWLGEMEEIHQLKAVISDNRYGLHDNNIHSVIITHQLMIKTRLGNIADEMLQSLHYQYINEFNECWVPDVDTEPNLAGELSHPVKKPLIPIDYVGPLSRFTPGHIYLESKHLLVIISGPEPQRNILETELLDQLANYTEPVLFIRGLPGETSLPTTLSNIIVVNHLPAAQLEEAIRSAEFIISRCGYSSIMDLILMQKKTILIPTPGQSEQEYLSTHLMNNRMALCIPQTKFKLKNAIELARSFNYQKFYPEKNNALAYSINKLIDKLNPADI